MRIVAIIGFAIVLLIATHAAGVLVIVTCSEKPDGAAGSDMCDMITGPAVSWWLAVVWPAILLGATLFVPILRRHVVLSALSILILAAVFWGWVLQTAGG